MACFHYRLAGKIVFRRVEECSQVGELIETVRHDQNTVILENGNIEIKRKRHGSGDEEVVGRAIGNATMPSIGRANGGGRFKLPKFKFPNLLEIFED